MPIILLNLKLLIDVLQYSDIVMVSYISCKIDCASNIVRFENLNEKKISDIKWYHVSNIKIQ